MKKLLAAVGLAFVGLGLLVIPRPEPSLLPPPPQIVGPAPVREAFSVARVMTRGSGWVGHGSAVPVSCKEQEDGSYLVAFLTARHVIGGQQMWVQVFEAPNYQQQSAMLEVVAKNGHYDLDAGILLVKSPEPIKCLDLDFRDMKLGERVWFAGYPDGDVLMIDDGLLLSTYWNLRFPSWDGAYHASPVGLGGMSGGAVLDSDGDVIGVFVGIDTRNSHGGIFIPILRFEEWLRTVADLEHAYV